MRKLKSVVMLVVVLIFAVQPFLQAQNKGRKKITRAKPPKFSKDDESIFFDDVFSEALVGDRPDNLGRPIKRTRPDNGGGSNGGGERPAGGSYAWKDIIAAEIIEDEIKTLKRQVDETVTTPSKFRGGGYKNSRRHFSMLAMLFAIISEYDGEVRFSKQAPELRDIFAQAADGSKVGSQAAYNQAKLRKQDLADVLTGNPITVAKESEAKIEDWSVVIDRSPLMQRLETAQQANLQAWIANEGAFKANRDKLLHEANLVAAMSEVLMRNGMPEAEEDEYTVFAKSMRDASREIVSSIGLDNYDGARKAVGAIGQACTQCHEAWR